MAEENKKIQQVYCFLDTNILIQFQTFDEVEWPKILQAKKVCLVLAPIVLRELDKHKTDYNNSRLQKRARMILSKLNRLLEAETVTDGLPQVRHNVTLMTLREPLINWEAEGLDRDEPDDRLLGSIIDFRNQHPSDVVLLLSDDSGPRFKAKSYKIPALAPPDELIHHIEPPTPEEKTIRELNEKLSVFINRIPKLHFGFWENGKVVDEITRPLNEAWKWQNPEEYVEDEITWKREALAQMLARADNTIGEDEVKKFTKEYEKYIADLKPALKMQFMKAYNPYCKLELTVINEGTATARGVHVDINFPLGSSFVYIDNLNSDIKIEVDMPEEPAIPEWAMPPMSEWEKNLLPPSLITLGNSINSLALFNSMSNSLNLPANFLSPKASKNTYFFEIFPFHRNIVTELVEQVGHHRRMRIKPMVVYLPANTQMGFTISYSILIEEVPNPITGELKIRWEQNK